jgi:hypothetical protein
MYDLRDPDHAAWAQPELWDEEPVDQRRHRRRVRRALFLSLALATVTSVIGVCAAMEDEPAGGADERSSSQWTVPAPRP